MRLFQLVAITLGLGLCNGAIAHSEAAKHSAGAVQLDVEESAAEQLRRVERALATEEYSEISTEDKSSVQAAIDRIRVQLGDHASAAEVNPEARTQIFNDQELVNNLLGRAHADSRMVCRRERSTGSNRMQQICMTVAQRREATENSRDALRNFHRVNPKTPNP